ncbi:Protein OS-9, partial [Rhizophlyctis rosea]
MDRKWLNVSVVLLWSSLTVHAATNLDVYRDIFDNPKNRLAIDSIPVSESELAVTFNLSDPSTIILPAAGERFVCTIPQAELAKKSEGSEAVAIRQQQGAQKALAQFHSLQKSKCIYYNQPYWIYEFCYNRHVRQFHILTDKEAEIDPTPQDFYLGKYGVPADTALPTTPDHSSKQKDMSKDVEIVTADQGDKSYAFLRSEWGGGTPCDILSGRARSITVEYLCSNPAYIDHITSIKETGACKYNIQIHSHSMCSEPVFLPVQSTHQHIKCSKIVSDSVALQTARQAASQWGANTNPMGGGILYSLPQLFSARNQRAGVKGHIGGGGKVEKGKKEGKAKAKAVVHEVHIFNPFAEVGRQETVLVRDAEGKLVVGKPEKGW